VIKISAQLSKSPCISRSNAIQFNQQQFYSISVIWKAFIFIEPEREDDSDSYPNLRQQLFVCV
jgi:hypothetical protein